VRRLVIYRQADLDFRAAVEGSPELAAVDLSVCPVVIYLERRGVLDVEIAEKALQQTIWHLARIFSEFEDEP
jgi:hypothetical protein